MSDHGDYRIDLEAFCGPMDLLLYLVRRNEVDIYDIPVAKIADQFVAYVDLMEALDIEYAAGFLVLAATLMDIKARMLVPQEAVIEGEEDEELLDPREELVRELLEYKQVRDTALYLQERFDERTHRFESGAETPDLDEKPLEEVQVWDLFAAFSTLLRQIGAGMTEIVSDDVPVAAYITLILERIGAGKRLAFAALFDGARNRAAIVGMFIALLELMRQRRIRAFQDREFGDITIELRDERA